MTRSLVLRIALVLAVILLGSLPFVPWAQPAPARAQAAGLDISQIIVAAANEKYLEGMPEVVSLGGPGAWVTLRGPATVTVTQIINLDSQDSEQFDVKLLPDEQRTFRWEDPYEQVIVRLVDLNTDEYYSQQLMQLVFGESAEALNSYVKQKAGSPEARAELLLTGIEVSDAFQKAIGETIDPKQYPNVKAAQGFANVLGMLNAAKDPSGKAVFPTFQNKNIMKILFKMAYHAASDDAYLEPCRSLISLLASMDMNSSGSAPAK